MASPSFWLSQNGNDKISWSVEEKVKLCHLRRLCPLHVQSSRDSPWEAWHQRTVPPPMNWSRPQTVPRLCSSLYYLTFHNTRGPHTAYTRAILRPTFDTTTENLGWNEKTNNVIYTAESLHSACFPQFPSACSINRQKTALAHHWPYGGQEPTLEPGSRCRCSWRAESGSRGGPPETEGHRAQSPQFFKAKQFCAYLTFKMETQIWAMFSLVI